MINPKQFRAPFIQKETIAIEVEKVRKQYAICQRTPIDILAFAEFDLKLEFDFAPIQQLDQDAFLSPDLTSILIDSATFRDPKQYARLRFSIAHELGHFFLHRDIYGKLEFKSTEEWISFIGDIPPEQYQWIEWQAYEFAGQLLIPSAKLVPCLDEAMNDADREGYVALGEDEVLEFCCSALHGDFGVSRQALRKRIKSAGLWPHPKLMK